MATQIRANRKFIRSGGALLSTVLALTASGALAAGGASSGAGQLLNEQTQQRPNLPDRLPEAQPQQPLQPAGSEDGAQVLVNSIRVTGGEGLGTDAEFAAVVAPAIGKRLTVGQLKEVAGWLTAYLRSKGWPLAQAYLPPQDATDGNIVITILRGHVQRGGAVIKADDIRLSQEFAKAMVDGALPDGDESPDQDALERAVLLLNDLPGITAHLTLERGTEPNSTATVVEVKEGAWVTGNASMDNFGNRYTGGIRGIGSASLNDPLGLGDQLSVSATEAARLQLYQFGYNAPLTSFGPRLALSFTHMHYRIGKELGNQNNFGYAQTVDGKLSYPFVRTRQTSIYGNISYAYKRLTDYTSATESSNRRIYEWSPSFNASLSDNLGGGGLTVGSLAVTSGILNRKLVASDVDSDRTSAQSSGLFSKMTGTAARLQHLDSDFSLFVSANGQLAAKNLDSSEKFILGGPSGIRAYPVGEGSGDVGWLTNVELRYDIPIESVLGTTQLVAFFDGGGVKLNRSLWSGAVSTATNRNYYNLSGAGLGLNLTQTGWYSVRGSWAHSIGDNPGWSTAGNNANGLHQNQQVWVQATAYF